MKLVAYKLCDLITYEKDPYRMDADAYDALIEHKGVCSAYQAAFDLIMKELNIPSLTVIGLVGQNAHAWGRVYINDKWQSVDVTFCDGEENNTYNKYWILFDEEELNNTLLSRTINQETQEELKILELTYKFD